MTTALTSRARAQLPTARTAGQTIERTETHEETDVASREEPEWTTVVWNDPVNLMSYVSYVFESYFGYSQHKAEKLMLQVHHEGRATVSRGGRERMEVDVQAMHGFGLWATLQQAGA